MSIPYVMHKKIAKYALLTVAVLASSSVVLANEISDVFTKGTATADFRLRREVVDQDGISNADADTLRSRITLRSGLFYGFQLGTQGDYISSLSDEDHYNAWPDNCPGQDNCNNAKIIDPDNGHKNEYFVKYTGISKVAATYGRQHIEYDNERFVGSVAWRQNDQTFNAFRLDNQLLPKTDISIAKVTAVHTIFGDDEPTGSQPQDTKFYHVGLSLTDSFKPVMYYYDIDNEDDGMQSGKPNVNLSNKSTGLRVTGSYPKKEGDRFFYAVEFANQDEGDDNTVNYSEDYNLIEIGGEFKTVQVMVGHEVLQGDADGTTSTEFQTPLATLHKFNGWADKFLTTPDGGLEDDYLSVTVPVGGFKIVAAYHNFDRNDTGSLASNNYSDLGDEWDFSIGRKIMKNYNVAVKYADYNSDDDVGNYTSTRKLWLEATAHFE